MGHNEFWLQFNNGKKEQLNDTKHGVRKEQVDKKFHNLFDAYDTNNNGTLEENEVQTIFGHLKNFAGDNVLDSSENLKAKSVFADQANMQDVDFQGFVKAVSDATSNIISSEETKTSDGGKEIKTEYKDGTTETIAFYSNGDYKWKKTEKRTLETSFELIIDGKKYKFNDEAKFKKALEKAEQKNIDSANINRLNEQAKKLSEGKLVITKKLPISKINVKSSSNENFEYKENYSPRYIAETLGVNTETEDGKKVIERLSYLPQEALEKLKDGKELKELISSQELEPTFDNISNVLEITEGVTLRNEEEYKATEAQRQEILTQIKAANFMANVYETLAGYNDQYTDSVGLFGLGSEGIGYVLNKLGLDGENHYQWADSCREFAKNASELKVLNPQKFKEGFKKIYGKTADKYGIDYNSDAFKKCFALAESGKAFDKDNKMTDEYKEAILKAMNIVADDPNDSTFNQVMNGFGEALIMIISFGLASGTEAGITLAKSTMTTFSKLGVQIASKQAKNKLLQGALRFTGQAVKLVGPALNEGTKMYLYTAAEGTLTNVSNRAIKQDGFDKLLDTQAQVMTNADGSFTFGAFAGVFGTAVTQKVMQRASKVASKVTTALSEKFSQGAVSANEVFATILEKSAPTKIAEAAAFVTDVLGFTAFESALAIVNNLDNYPDGYSVEDLTKIIWEELKSQGYNLGQIKIVAWLMSSRSARIQSMNYMRDNIPQLKGAKIEQKGEGFKINLADGRKIECKNANEMIASLHLMVRNETAFSSKFDVKNKDITAPEIDIELPNATTYADAVEKLKSASSSREITTPNGEKVIIYHRNALNLGDYTFARFNQKGTLVEQGTISSNKFAEKFGVGLNESTKLSSSGMLMMSLDMGIIESLVRTIKLNYDHQKFNNAESALDKLAIMYGYDLSDKEQNKIFQMKLRSVSFEESDTPEQRAAKIDTMFKPLNVDEIATDILLKNKNLTREVINEISPNNEFSDRDITSINEMYQINPELVIKLLGRKDSEGYPLCTRMDIRNIVLNSQGIESYVKEILDIKEDGECIYSEGHQVIELAQKRKYYVEVVYPQIKEIIKKDKAFVSELVEDTENLENNCIKQKYTVYDVNELCRAYEINPEFAKELLTNYNGENGARSINPALISALSSICDTPEKQNFARKIIDEKNKTEYRFLDKTLLNLTKLYIEDPEMAKEIINERDKYINEPAYSDNTINEFIESYFKNKELATSFYNEKVLKENGKEERRFQFSDIPELIALKNTNDKDFVDFLLNQKSSSGNPRFRHPSEIFHLIQARDLADKETVIDLLNQNRYSAYEVRLMVELYQEYGKENVDKIHNSNNAIKSVLSPREIGIILKLYKSHGEEKIDDAIENLRFLDLNAIEKLFDIEESKREAVIQKLTEWSEIKGASGDPLYPRYIFEEFILLIDKISLDKTDELVIGGISLNEVTTIKKNVDKIDEIFNLLNNGVSLEITCKMLEGEDFTSKYTEKMNEIESAPNELRDFLNSPDLYQALKNNTQSKFQTELLKMLYTNGKGMNFKIKQQILSSGLTVEEFLNSLKAFAKSTYKLAYEKPNQYLAGIDTKYTTPVDGKLPKVEGEVLEKQRKQIEFFMIANLGKITRALKYIDTDTLSHMMDRRTSLFEESLKKMNNLTDENYELLSKVLKCKSELTNKPLSPKEKIQLCQVTEILQLAGIDMQILKDAVANGQINPNAPKQKIQDALLEAAGIDPNDTSLDLNKKKFNEEFSYLALNTNFNSPQVQEQLRQLEEAIQTAIVEARKNGVTRTQMIAQLTQQMREPIFKQNTTIEQRNIANDILKMLNNIEQYTDQEIVDKYMESVKIGLEQYQKNDELYTVIRESVVGDFKTFINNPENKYGQANAKTKDLFIQNGLNYEQWLNPDVSDIDFEVAGKKVTIKMWDRNPQEDLFMGNKTTCCTAIGTGGNAGSTPVYLLNTSYNVVELYDSNGNVVGMSRVFMGKINGKPSLIMDNIELNKTFIKGMSEAELKKIRDGFFQYMNNYVEKVTGDANSQVYFYSGDIHVPNSDLQHSSAITSFVGDLSQETVYVNSSGCRWIDPRNMESCGEIDWLVVPKK